MQCSDEDREHRQEGTLKLPWQLTKLAIKARQALETSARLCRRICQQIVLAGRYSLQVRDELLVTKDMSICLLLGIAHGAV
jgi:hypothetical protein